jgi:glyoxylase-like metal-dependent hydrolase (beta-lactamase superfamily II)
MQTNYAAAKDRDPTPVLATYEAKVAAATTPAEKARRTGDLTTMRWIVSAIQGATLAYPTDPIAVADMPKRIELGGVSAIIEFHAGHSPTDLIITIPERDVVFTGDLFFNRAYPVVSDADMLAWRRALDLFLGYSRATQFIPGHGQIGRIDDVREQAVLMDDLRGHAERMIREGATADEAEARYVVPKRYQSYEMMAWTFTIGGAMRKYYAALQGGSDPHRAASSPEVRTQQRSTSATLHACAMQPLAVNGDSASKISLIDPMHA